MGTIKGWPRVVAAEEVAGPGQGEDIHGRSLPRKEGEGKMAGTTGKLGAAVAELWRKLGAGEDIHGRSSPVVVCFFPFSLSSKLCDDHGRSCLT